SRERHRVTSREGGPNSAEAGLLENPPRRLKIAFGVHDYHRSGGHSRYVAELAARFSEQHEVHVFANSIEEDRRSKIQFHRAPAGRLDALTNVLTFAACVRSRVGSGFDVVHVQGYCGVDGNVVTTHICNEAWYRALSGQAGSATWRDRVFHWVTSWLEHR